MKQDNSADVGVEGWITNGSGKGVLETVVERASLKSPPKKIESMEPSVTIFAREGLLEQSNGCKDAEI